MKTKISVVIGILIVAIIVGVVYLDYNNNGKPIDLKVELLDAPYGINSKNPTFGWKLNSKHKGCNQKAYQVVFSKTKTSMKNKPRLFTAQP